VSNTPTSNNGFAKFMASTKDATSPRSQRYAISTEDADRIRNRPLVAPAPESSLEAAFAKIGGKKVRGATPQSAEPVEPDPEAFAEVGGKFVGKAPLPPFVVFCSSGLVVRLLICEQRHKVRGEKNGDRASLSVSILAHRGLIESTPIHIWTEPSPVKSGPDGRTPVRPLLELTKKSGTYPCLGHGYVPTTVSRLRNRSSGAVYRQFVISSKTRWDTTNAFQRHGFTAPLLT
jgi:hypothetical protein